MSFEYFPQWAHSWFIWSWEQSFVVVNLGTEWNLSPIRVVELVSYLYWSMLHSIDSSVQCLDNNQIEVSIT